MSSVSSALDVLRREIDEIDDAVHDLLMRRATLSEKVRVLKDGERVFLRPAREAQILRRLLGRHGGPLPAEVVVRMWRELLAASTRQQGPFAIAVVAPDERRGLWDLARDHFGSLTPTTAVDTPMAALRMVGDGSATVAVVPVPEEDDPDPWWRHMLGDDDSYPRVVARLPFCQRGGARGEASEALAIAAIPYEPSGRDRSLVGMELGGDVSRGRVKEMLEAAGLPVTALKGWPAAHGDAAPVLAEIGDYLPPGDARLGDFVERIGSVLLRLGVIGGYAEPISPAA